MESVKDTALSSLLKKAAHTPNDRRRRLQGNLELGDNAERAASTDKEVDGVHFVRNEIA